MPLQICNTYSHTVHKTNGRNDCLAMWCVCVFVAAKLRLQHPHECEMITFNNSNSLARCTIIMFQLKSNFFAHTMCRCWYYRCCCCRACMMSWMSSNAAIAERLFTRIDFQIDFLLQIHKWKCDALCTSERISERKFAIHPQIHLSAAPNDSGERDIRR